MPKVSQTQQFYDGLTVGECVYVLVNGIYLPKAVAGKVFLPFVVKGHIKEKVYCVRSKICLKLKFEKAKQAHYTPNLNRDDISRNVNTLVKRQIRELKQFRDYHQVQLDKVLTLLTHAESIVL